MAKAEGKFYADLAKVKAGKPIAKKRKRKKTLAVDEDQILTGEKQPNKLGPSAHSAPSTYPLGQALSDVSASREAELQRQADNYCRQALAKGSTPPLWRRPPSEPQRLRPAPQGEPVRPQPRDEQELARRRPGRRRSEAQCRVLALLRGHDEGGPGSL
jgi:hypothetical protein